MRLFCFGLGFSAQALAARLQGRAEVAGTSRQGDGDGLWPFARGVRLPAEALAGTTHVLVSIPPDEAGDPAFDAHANDIAALPGLAWLGYLSTTGVYGDRGGGWVDEDTPPAPGNARSQRRLAAEQAWLSLVPRGVPAHVFRLAGIYGPGRSQIEAVAAGTAHRVDKPGQLFSRIHVDDIAAVLLASMARPRPGGIYNLADDEPASPADVVAFAAGLFGLPPPPLVPFAEAKLSPMAASFYAENRRVRNDRIKRELGVALHFPTYREGLRDCLARAKRSRHDA